ncbi:MAG: SGNH/GDSL hydrolase family protein [Lentisphaerae bacterium]|nr:SGNH/GDSL hydrolase family protein [Lentisphaerota bacterium]
MTTLTVEGDWKVRIAVPPAVIGGGPGPEIVGVLDVPPPDIVTVRAERHAELPLFDSATPCGWKRGVALRGVRAQECTARYALDPASLEVRDVSGMDVPPYERGKDYEADLEWGTLGRLAAGRIAEKQPVCVRYRYVKLRLDSIVLTAKGRLALRKGKSDIALPHAPHCRAWETDLAHIWVKGRLARLTADHLFPILETDYPEPARSGERAAAERLLPESLLRLRDGRRLKLLAWGDSVTDGSYLTHETSRWQAQFAARLKKRFPKADLEFLTEAWGGHTTGDYLGEPAGSPHHYREKVLAAKPQLIVSEFVNDASLNPEQVETRYGRFLADFKAIGAEWIILTPHYVRPDWMGLTREREIDDDPRPYVAGLRQFADRHGVALADAASRYGRLWRQGIPYSSLMHNTINHPDARGMRIFADSLMALFE